MWPIVQLLLSPFIFEILSLSPFQSDTTNKYFNNTLRLRFPEDTAEHTQYVELTETEKNQVHKLRDIMGDELQMDFEKCDDFLIRWLQECDMGIPCASKKLKYSLKWRRSTLGEIMEPNKTFVTAKEDPTQRLHGRAKDGAPIMVYTMSGWDVRKLVLSGKSQNLLKHHTQLTERHFQASIMRNEKSGEIRLIPGVIVANIQGMSLKSHSCAGCMVFFRDLSHMGNDHYPRSSKLIVLYNAPAFAKPFVQAFNAFLSPYFQKILKVFGREKEEWSSFLRRYISNEEFWSEFVESQK